MFGKIFIGNLVIGIFLLSHTQHVNAQTCSAPPIGLVSSWSGDGNALDARSRNNGTLQNGVTHAAGYIGQAFNLAGNNGDRVLMGNPSNLQLVDHTVEAWVKRSSSTIVTNSPNGSGVGIIFAYGQGGYALYIDQVTGKLKHGQVGFSEVAATTLAINDTNWHHVAVTRRGPAFTGGTQTIFYLDGVADVANNYSPPFTFTTNAAIGARGDGSPDNAFFGLIDELAIYDRALSPAQIAAITAAGTAGKCKPLATVAPNNQVLWLAGDGNATDSSGNANGVTLQNGTEYQVGKVGQSFKFDGVDDQITVPHNANQNSGTNLTVEAWVNAPGASQGSPILQKRSSANVGGYTLEYFGNQSLQFCVQISDVYQCIAGVNIVTNNVWNHVVGTYDGTAVRLIINGGQFNLSQPATGSIDTVSEPIVIGRNVVNSVAFQGSIDEVGVYNRALSISEIQSISNAGLAGKYKVQSTVPANIAAWYTGDGNTNDLQAANNATLNGGATYASGKVGQAFSLNGTNAYITAPSTPANDPTGAVNGASMEAWVYFNQRPSDAGHQFFIMSANGANPLEGFDIHADPDNFFKLRWRGTAAGFADVSIQALQWYHVVSTFSTTAGVEFYVNGIRIAGANEFNPRTVGNAPLTIGRDTFPAGNTHFNGLIDEPAVYGRRLTADEIRDQYYAGSLGKYKAAQNPTVANVSSNGDLTATFTGLTAAGAVHQTPIDLSLLPALPAGATSVGLTYDISSTVAAGTPTSLCFRLPALSQTQFSNLGVLHLEGGVWVDRATAKNTVNRTICASTPTLSPFAIARVLNPTSASVSIAGRVTTASGNGIRNAMISLTDSSGQTRTARTGSFGYYRFDEVMAGENYVLSANSKQFTFADPTRIILVSDNVTDADFTEIALPFENKLRRLSR